MSESDFTRNSSDTVEIETNSIAETAAELSDYERMSPEELRDRILKARREKNAVLLVHNYQRMEVQGLADFLGDSLGLSIEAARSDASLIVFCGVDFMAESAKILSPDKKVVIPDRRANCPMALMVDIEILRDLKRKHPDALVVTYVNSTAEVKAESDICCTSSNAVEVVRSLGNRKIIFTPDRNLAMYVQSQTGADIIPWEGFCYVHDNFTRNHLEQALREHPGALFIAHPECRMEVLERADLVTSTSGMVHWTEDNLDLIEQRGVIIGTEIGLVEQLQQRFPESKIYPLSSGGICRTMKLTTLPKVCWAIEKEQYEIDVPRNIREKAYQALKRMIDIRPID